MLISFWFRVHDLILVLCRLTCRFDSLDETGLNHSLSYLDLIISLWFLVITYECIFIWIRLSLKSKLHPKLCY